MEKALHGLGEPLPRRHRAPARRLDAGARISAVAAAAGAVARLEVARRRRLRHRRQGRARGDGRPVPPRRGAKLAGAVAAGRRMAGDGLRVLGVARAAFRARPDCPATSTTSTSSSSAWSAWPTRCARPCRPAISECYAAGIRVVMITGDYPGHGARTSPARSGSTPARRASSPGRSWTRMDDAELRERIARRSTSSPAWCRSRSCGWSTRSRPTARWWR